MEPINNNTLPEPTQVKRGRHGHTPAFRARVLGACAEPGALGRSNWLFAGSLRSGQRTANVMSQIQWAKMNGYEPYAYLEDVLKRLPTQSAIRIDELLPHNWQPIDNL